VAEWLRERGLLILATRYKKGVGEVDLVALDGETLVFIEVKRRAKLRQPTEDLIDPSKLERIRTTAESFMHEFGLTGREARIDVVFDFKSGIDWVRNVVVP
jgi:putative endonuclease